MAEAGIFEVNDVVELINGAVVEMSLEDPHTAPRSRRGPTFSSVR
jgi:hypothetical protein